MTWTCHDRDELGCRQRLGRMLDHELVAYGRDDDSRHEHDVEVRVAVPRHRRPVGGELEPPLRDVGDVAEVEPPERGRDQEREAERRQPCDAERQLGRRRAGDHDRLAERDDDEQLEALGEVRALDIPGRRVELLAARHAVEDERRRVIDPERHEPQHGLGPGPEATPPASQKTPEKQNQSRIWSAGSRSGASRSATTKVRNACRPTWIATYAPANSSARLLNASGMRRPSGGWRT